jgi:hypothetical protein
MSVVGQTRKSNCAIAMSAFPPIATKLRTSREVRFVPLPEVPQAVGTPYDVSSASKAFASFRSRVLNPSVNQP